MYTLKNIHDSKPPKYVIYRAETKIVSCVHIYAFKIPENNIITYSHIYVIIYERNTSIHIRNILNQLLHLKQNQAHIMADPGVDPALPHVWMLPWD